jgi:hypothetical protein
MVSDLEIIILIMLLAVELSSGFEDGKPLGIVKELDFSLSKKLLLFGLEKVLNFLPFLLSPKVIVWSFGTGIFGCVRRRVRRI